MESNVDASGVPLSTRLQTESAEGLLRELNTAIRKVDLLAPSITEATTGAHSWANAFGIDTDSVAHEQTKQFEEISKMLLRTLTKERGYITRKQIMEGVASIFFGLRPIINPAPEEVVADLAVQMVGNSAAFTETLFGDMTKMVSERMSLFESKLDRAVDRLDGKIAKLAGSVDKKESTGGEIEALSKVSSDIATVEVKIDEVMRLASLTRGDVAVVLDRADHPSTVVPVASGAVPDVKTFADALKKHQTESSKVALEEKRKAAKKRKAAAAEKAKSVAAEKAEREARAAERRAKVLRGEKVYTDEQETAFKEKLAKRGEKFIPLQKRVAADGIKVVSSGKVKPRVAQTGKYTAEQTAKFIKENFTDKGRKYYTRQEREQYKAKKVKSNTSRKG